MFDYPAPKILDSVKPIGVYTAVVYEDGSVNFDLKGELGNLDLQNAGRAVGQALTALGPALAGIGVPDGIPGIVIDPVEDARFKAFREAMTAWEAKAVEAAGPMPNFDDFMDAPEAPEAPEDEA